MTCFSPSTSIFPVSIIPPLLHTRAAFASKTKFRRLGTLQNAVLGMENHCHREFKGFIVRWRLTSLRLRSWASQANMHMNIEFWGTLYAPYSVAARARTEQEVFYPSPKRPKEVLWLSQHAIQRVQGDLSSGVKRRGVKLSTDFRSSAEVKERLELFLCLPHAPS